MMEGRVTGTPLRTTIRGHHDGDRFRDGVGHMTATASFGANGENHPFEVLWTDTERAFCRLPRVDADRPRYAFIPVLSGADHPTPESVNRITHEYELKDCLEATWAVRPVDLVRERGLT